MRYFFAVIVLLISCGCGGDNPRAGSPDVTPLTTIDFEGVALGTEVYDERFTSRPYGDFECYIWEGFYFPVNIIPDIHPSSGSDNVVTQRLEISNSKASEFSIVSIQIAEKVNNIDLAPIKITGYYSDGGIIETIFNADGVSGFETLNFSEMWSNLVKINFSVEFGLMHFDNAILK